MTRSMTLLTMLLVSLAVFAGAGRQNQNERLKFGHVQPVIETEQPMSAPHISMNKAAVTVNQIAGNIGNLRAVLGAGRHVELDATGTIHVGSLQGNGATYSLFYAGSVDAGATWDVQTGLGAADPNRDRYPAIAVKGTTVSIAYHEEDPSGWSAGKVASNTDPMGLGSWTLTGKLDLYPSGWISFNSAAPTDNMCYATWVEFDSTPWNLFSVAKSTDGGDTWFALPAHQDSLLTSGSGVPVIAGDGGFAMLTYWNNDADALGLDTTITNYPQGNGGEWPMVSYTTDGGATWTDFANLFGTNITDYPSSTGYVDGAPHTLRWAGGTNWNNVSQGVISNGSIYHVSGATAIDVTDHTLDGLSGSILSYKPVGMGGAWTHRVMSPTVYMAGGTLQYGDCWYGEIAISRANPNWMVGVWTDQATDQNKIIFTGSGDGGNTWVTDSTHTIKLDAITDLGLIGGGRVFIQTSSFFNSDNMVDVIFLEDIAGAITNSALYHTRTDVTSLVVSSIKDKAAPTKFTLSQNYPNPFNPGTSIKYQTLDKAGKVSLRIYNLLGQEVRTLVSGSETAGEHVALWDGKDNVGHAVASGIYLYKIGANGVSATKKMMLMK